MSVSRSRSLRIGFVFVVQTALASGCSHGGRDDVDAGHGKDMRHPVGSRDLSDPGGPFDDGGVSDLSSPSDLRMSGGMDFAMPADMLMTADMSRPTDMSMRPPCLAGAGWAAFRFKYKGSTFASIEAFGLPDSAGFSANAVFSTSFVDAANGGGIEIASGNWILILYSINGLSTIRSATLSIYGRSYNTTASGSFNGWTPVYGDNYAPTNSVSNAWPYHWTSLDFSSSLNVGDSPVGIRLYAGPNSNDLVINTVELCLDAD